MDITKKTFTLVLAICEMAYTECGILDVVIVLDLVSQVRDVVLMNVYLDLGNSGGSGFWNGGI
jgi:hypothetical protein